MWGWGADRSAPAPWVRAVSAPSPETSGRLKDRCLWQTEQTLFLIATYDSIICVIIEGPSLGCSSCRKCFDGQLHQTPVTAVAQMSEISDVTVLWQRGSHRCVCVHVCVCEVDQFMRCHRPLITPPALCTVKPSAASQIELSRGKWGSTSHTAGTWFEKEDRKKLLNTIQNLIWSYG